MYFVFRAELKSWHNKTLLARSEPLLRDCEPHWWLAEPLTKKPQRFKFLIDGSGPKFDNYNCGSGIDMYSQRMLDILEQHGVNSESIPSDVFDLKSRVQLDLNYSAFHLLEKHESIDLKNSELVFDTEDAEFIIEIKKLELKQEILDMQRPLLRIAEFYCFVLIHQSLKSSLETSGITGCQFIPVNEFHT